MFAFRWVEGQLPVTTPGLEQIKVLLQMKVVKGSRDSVQKLADIKKH